MRDEDIFASSTLHISIACTRQSSGRALANVPSPFWGSYMIAVEASESYNPLSTFSALGQLLTTLELVILPICVLRPIVPINKELVPIQASCGTDFPDSTPFLMPALVRAHSPPIMHIYTLAQDWRPCLLIERGIHNPAPIFDFLEFSNAIARPSKHAQQPRTSGPPPASCSTQDISEGLRPHR